MKCPTCVASGERSTVTPGYSVVTAMFANSFYDEDGQYHRHDPNSRTTSFGCSNGHEWADSTFPKCRIGGCSWNEREAVKRGTADEDGQTNA